MPVLRQNATALYRQIADRLRRDMARGSFEPTGRLPSEADIGSRFDVSRVTVRLALDELEKQGLIDRQKGKGTFTSGKKVRHELSTLRSFHETLRRQGLDATMQVKDVRTVATPKELRRHFGARRPSCILLQRLHLVGREPIAFGRSYLPIKRDDLLGYDIDTVPTYAILESLAARPIMQATIELGAAEADEDIAKALVVKPKITLLTMERTSFFADGKCSEHSIFFVRPERYKFSWNTVFGDEG